MKSNKQSNNIESKKSRKKGNNTKNKQNSNNNTYKNIKTPMGNKINDTSITPKEKNPETQIKGDMSNKEQNNQDNSCENVETAMVNKMNDTSISSKQKSSGIQIQGDIYDRIREIELKHIQKCKGIKRIEKEPNIILLEKEIGGTFAEEEKRTLHKIIKARLMNLEKELGFLRATLGLIAPVITLITLILTLSIQFTSYKIDHPKNAKFIIEGTVDVNAFEQNDSKLLIKPNSKDKVELITGVDLEIVEYGGRYEVVDKVTGDEVAVVRVQNKVGANINKSKSGDNLQVILEENGGIVLTSTDNKYFSLLTNSKGQVINSVYEIKERFKTRQDFIEESGKLRRNIAVFNKGVTIMYIVIVAVLMSVIGRIIIKGYGDKLVRKINLYNLISLIIDNK
nr:hypothetical protein [uncultured Niameybacter sp.]